MPDAGIGSQLRGTLLGVAAGLGVLLPSGGSGAEDPFPRNFPTGRAPAFVALADLDGDGAADIVSAGQLADDVSALRGHGDGSFASPVSFPVGADPMAVAVHRRLRDGEREDQGLARLLRPWDLHEGHQLTRAIDCRSAARVGAVRTEPGAPRRPQQLEQPIQGSHPEGSDVSGLGHLLEGHETMPDARGLFLAETWRLHPTLCEFTSEIFARGRRPASPGRT